METRTWLRNPSRVNMIGVCIALVALAAAACGEGIVGDGDAPGDDGLARLEADEEELAGAEGDERSMASTGPTRPICDRQIVDLWRCRGAVRKVSVDGNTTHRVHVYHEYVYDNGTGRVWLRSVYGSRDALRNIARPCNPLTCDIPAW